jgi:phosphoglycerol transferase MdoB-like AlkP superfamily enzyme
MEHQFPGEDLEYLYLSSLYYSDHSLGNFIKAAKKEPWYRETLFVVLADHGHRLLVEKGRYQRDKYHVPMLWFGGALQVKDTVVNRFCSQTDLVKTLNHQLGFRSYQYPWSRNIFAPNYFDGAFYVFNEGISLIQPQGQLIYDATGGHVLDSTAFATQDKIDLVKAHLQSTYGDYLNK